MFGDVARDRGDLAGAKNLYLDALRLFRTAGDRRSEASAVYNLGHLAGLAGDTDEAEHRAEEARAIFHELGDSRGEASCWGPAGGLAGEIGQWQKAYELHHNALDLLRELARLPAQLAPRRPPRTGPKGRPPPPNAWPTDNRVRTS